MLQYPTAQSGNLRLPCTY